MKNDLINIQCCRVTTTIKGRWEWLMDSEMIKHNDPASKDVQAPEAQFQNIYCWRSQVDLLDNSERYVTFHRIKLFGVLKTP